MSTYTPDVWTLVKLTSPKYGGIVKVLAGWYGEYAGSDSWRMNSGITGVGRSGDAFYISGYSGSTYICHEGCERLSMYTESILKHHQAMMRELVDGSTMNVLSMVDYLKGEVHGRCS